MHTKFQKFRLFRVPHNLWVTICVNRRKVSFFSLKKSEFQRAPNDFLIDSYHFLTPFSDAQTAAHTQFTRRTVIVFCKSTIASDIIEFRNIKKLSNSNLLERNIRGPCWGASSKAFFWSHRKCRVATIKRTIYAYRLYPFQMAANSENVKNGNQERLFQTKHYLPVSE